MINHDLADQRFMAIALALAKEGQGRTFPNPTVGCVVVCQQQIVASARTADGGRPHAEAIALSQIDATTADGSTLYTTLEPCCHSDKMTPPCIAAIIAARVKRVVIAVRDPNPQVCGKAILLLKNAGILVTTNLMADQAVAINQGYCKKMQSSMPYVTLKMAVSIDGKIALANGSSKWITGDEARHYAHHLRMLNDAIMVGVNTVIHDDPILDCRITKLEKFSPIKIVLDSNFRIPENAKLLRQNQVKTIVIILQDAAQLAEKKVKFFEDQGHIIIAVDKKDAIGSVNLNEALVRLVEYDIGSIMVEGGGRVAAGLIKEDLLDQLIMMRAPKIIGGDGISSISALGLTELGDDVQWRRKEILLFGEDHAEIYHRLDKGHKL